MLRGASSEVTWLPYHYQTLFFSELLDVTLSLALLNSEGAPDERDRQPCASLVPLLAIVCSTLSSPRSLDHHKVCGLLQFTSLISDSSSQGATAICL